MDLEALSNMPPWEWPDDAGKTIREILTDHRADDSERLLAAELAGDSVVIDDELVDVLLSILRNGDEPETLRAKAAVALGPVLEESYLDGFDDPGDMPITEETFHGIQKSLRTLFADTGIPKLVRRRVLEGSVRAPQDWHREAVLDAYSGGDAQWKLTAVFSMRWVPGFEDKIMEALESDDPKVHHEAVCGAGEWTLAAAWPHVSGLVASEHTEKHLLLAAIEAVGAIRPKEAGMALVHLADSGDEDVAEAAGDVIFMAHELAEQELGEDGEETPFD